MAKEDAWIKGYRETQARYMDELRKEREQAERDQQAKQAQQVKKGGKS